MKHKQNRIRNAIVKSFSLNSFCKWSIYSCAFAKRELHFWTFGEMCWRIVKNAAFLEVFPARKSDCICHGYNGRGQRQDWLKLIWGFVWRFVWFGILVHVACNWEFARSLGSTMKYFCALQLKWNWHLDTSVRVTRRGVPGFKTARMWIALNVCLM